MSMVCCKGLAKAEDVVTLYAVEMECPDCGEWLSYVEDIETEKGDAHAITFFRDIESACRIIDDSATGHYRIKAVTCVSHSVTQEDLAKCKKFGGIAKNDKGDKRKIN